MSGNEIGYVVLPVIPSFRGITGQVQGELNKAFKGAGTNAGKIMGQAAGAAFASEPALGKAMGAAPAGMTVLTAATDKQTDAVLKLQTAHTKLATAISTPDQQSRVIVAQDKQTDAILKSESQVRQATRSNDDFARSIKRVNDEQKRSTEILTGTQGSGGFGDALKSDLDKVLKGDTQGALNDFGAQLGAKAGQALRAAVKDVTGMSVDAITDKVKGAASALGVDLEGVLTTARDEGARAAVGQAAQDIAGKAGGAAGGFLRDQVQNLTGLDVGGLPGMQQLGQQASEWLNRGGSEQIINWATGGGPGQVLEFLRNGGLGNAFQAARQGGWSGLLNSARGFDPSSAASIIDSLTGSDFATSGLQSASNIIGSARSGDVAGLAQNLAGLIGDGSEATPLHDYLTGLTDTTTGLHNTAKDLLGDHVPSWLSGIAEKLPWLGDLEQSVEQALSSVRRSFPTADPDPDNNPNGLWGSMFGVASNLMPWVHPRQPLGPNSTDALHRSIFGDDTTGIGLGGSGTGGGGGPISTSDMQVDASVATISAGSVSLGGNISLPGLNIGGGGGGGGIGSRSSILGSASATSHAADSLYAGDTGGSYFATGGPIGTDNALFWGTPGEWVIRKPTVDKYGPTKMAAINAGYYASGGPIGDGTSSGHHGGPRGSATDPIYTMPSAGFTSAINQQAGPKASGGNARDALQSALGGIDVGQAANIGHQFMKDTFGLGSLFPDPLSGGLGQAGMSMLSALFGQISSANLFAPFGPISQAGAGDSPFGMIPAVAGIPHPDDAGPQTAGIGDALAAGVPHEPGQVNHNDNSVNLTVNGYSASEVGNQVYRNLGSSGVPNTPRVMTHTPVGIAP